MTVDRIQDEVRADDSIQKFQGRWIGSDGWEFPVHARYVAWGIFAVIFPLVLLVDWLSTGSISPLPLIDLIVAVGLTSVLANLTSGEVSLNHAVVYLTRTARAGWHSRRRGPRSRSSRARPRPISRRALPARFTTHSATTDSATTDASSSEEPLVEWPAPAYGPSTLTDPHPPTGTAVAHQPHPLQPGGHDQ